MENGGNQKVNAIFEAHLSVEKPTNHADLQTRERYVRDKYERRKFYDPAAFSTAPSRPAARPARPQKEISLPALRTAPVGAPSEVAQRRIEERRLRNQGISPKEGEKTLRRVGSSSGPDSSSPSKKKSSRSKKNGSNASSSVDLLDFGNTPSPQAASAAPPADDLFGFLKTEDPKAAAKAGGQVFDSFASTTALDGISGSPRKGSAAADIMALYSSGGGGNANRAPSNGFGGPGNNNGYPNGGGMPANGGGNMLNARMQKMNLNQQSMSNNQQRSNTMTPQQQQMMMMQQQQQMMMMMQQQQRMGQQNGNFMPPQQQQQQQHQGFGGMNGMAQNDGFGGQMMGGGMGQQQQATTSKKEDPFASLGGRNFFR
jgi:hypothetical protein